MSSEMSPSSIQQTEAKHISKSLILSSLNEGKADVISLIFGGAPSALRQEDQLASLKAAGVMHSGGAAARGNGNIVTVSSCRPNLLQESSRRRVAFNAQGVPLKAGRLFPRGGCRKTQQPLAAGAGPAMVNLPPLSCLLHSAPTVSGAGEAKVILLLGKQRTNLRVSHGQCWTWRSLSALWSGLPRSLSSRSASGIGAPAAAENGEKQQPGPLAPAVLLSTAVTSGL
ncbi:hypothetical protein Efla_000222 [Eimeria flavescens]